VLCLIQYLSVHHRHNTGFCFPEQVGIDIVGVFHGKPDGDDVCLFAGLDTADVAAHAQGLRAARGGEQQQMMAGHG